MTRSIRPAWVLTLLLIPVVALATMASGWIGLGIAVLWLAIPPAVTLALAPVYEPRATLGALVALGICALAAVVFVPVSQSRPSVVVVAGVASVCGIAFAFDDGGHD